MIACGGIKMVIWLSLLVCVLGALGYALSNNGKVSELGRLAYLAGLVVFLLQIPTHVTFLR
jgi:hypothetical protein